MAVSPRGVAVAAAMRAVPHVTRVHTQNWDKFHEIFPI